MGPAEQIPSSVPSSVPADQSQGPDVNQLIQNIVNPLDVQRAMTPIPGGADLQMPSALQTPITPFRPAPLNPDTGIGASYGRAVGIGNTITGAMNVIGSVVNAEAQQKQAQISDAAKTILSSQHNMDQAKQQLDIAMQTGDTKTVDAMNKIIAANQNSMNKVLEDPKMRKALAKGFNFNYTDPSQNKTEYHAAVMNAIKGLKTEQEKKQAIMQVKQQQQEQAAKNAAAAFSSSRPQTLAPNTMAQARVEAEMAQQKAAIDALKAQVPLQSASIRAQAQVDAAHERALGQTNAEAMRAKGAMDVATANNATREKVANLEATMKRLGMANDRSLVVLRQQLKDNSPSAAMDYFAKSADAYQKQLSDVEKGKTAIANALSKLGNFGNGAVKAKLQQQYQNLERQQQAAQDSWNSRNMYVFGALGIDPNEVKGEMQTPDVNVEGKGAANGAAAGTKSNSNSADINPDTGKPFSSNIPTVDKILIHTKHGIVETSKSAAKTVDQVNRDASKIKQFFGLGDQTN